MEMVCIAKPPAMRNKKKVAPLQVCQGCLFAVNASAASQAAEIDTINAIIADSIGTLVSGWEFSCVLSVCFERSMQK